MTEDANLVTTVTRVLGPLHADLITTRSPGEALYALQSVGYERHYRARLVLIDALISGVDGPNLVNTLRRDPHVAGATIALLSSLSANVVENIMRSWGADGYLLTNRGVIHIKTAIDGWLGVNKP